MSTDTAMRRYFERTGTNAHQLARAVGVQWRTIAAVAKGRSRPSVETAVSIEEATAGEVTAAELLGIAKPVEATG